MAISPELTAPFHNGRDSMFHAQQSTRLKRAARVALGCMLITTGLSHLTFARREFQAQVPDWVPLPVDTTVLSSGVVEVALGAALVFSPPDWERQLGRLAAAFFTAVFPGNLSQWRHRRSAFGLDTDGKRVARLFLQPVLVEWALWSTSRK